MMPSAYTPIQIRHWTGMYVICYWTIIVQVSLSVTSDRQFS